METRIWRQRLLDSFRGSLAFPWTLVSACLFCVFWMMENHWDQDAKSQWMTKLVMAGAWAISVSFLMEVVSRNRGKMGELLRLCIPVVPVLWFFTAPETLGLAQWTQYCLLVAATHLGIALCGGPGELGFWHWNRKLLQQALESAFFAVVLGAGASLALLAVEKLFSLDISYRWWTDIWICVFSLFVTFHFLTGVPANPKDAQQEMPAYFRLLSTRVLLPLAVLYLGILYAYGAKILLQLSLPNGWVSAPILVFAGIGLFAQLLLWPVAQETEEKWVRLWTRWFQLLLLPLCLLLGIAIFRRLSDYGLTEERYLVAVLAVWIPTQAIWFLSGTRSLRYIPASLLVLCLVCGWGPWGAFESSLNNQLHRFESTMASLGVAPGQKISKEVSGAQQKKIRSSIEYLIEHHEGRGLETWFPNLERARVETYGSGRLRYHWGLVDSLCNSIGLPADINSGTSKTEVSLEWEENFTIAVPSIQRLELLDSMIRQQTDPIFVLKRNGKTSRFDLRPVLALADQTLSTWQDMKEVVVIQDTLSNDQLIPLKVQMLKVDGQWRVDRLRALILYPQ